MPTIERIPFDNRPCGAFHNDETSSASFRIQSPDTPSPECVIFDPVLGTLIKPCAWATTGPAAYEILDEVQIYA
jgi:hypothetical protein